MVEKPRSAEVHGGPGFRIRTEVPRIDVELIRLLHQFDTPTISDQLNRLYTVSAEIKPVTELTQKLIGPACTVKVLPGDNLMVHKALDIVKPGDIIVVDSNGSDAAAILGDLVATKASHRGVAGFIADGLVRDIEGIRQTNVTVFARGVTPNGPLHRGPGEINYPIQCGGVVVNPGDIVVGDINGVVIIPIDFVSTLIERLTEKMPNEIAYKNAVEKGNFSNNWVDAMLQQQLCEIS